mgnify:CR=1 FL=1
MGVSMIKKILIANRGEIACRVIRTARELGIETVAVFSDADRNAMHVELADQAVHIGAAPVGESYLLGDRIIDAAKRTGADAIHPGYGFLSENPDFVDAVAKAGLIFIGPSADAIRAMGLKDKAKAMMEKAGVPVVPGYHGDEQDADFLAKQADKIGYPVLIKARAGGGGKGMRLVEKPDDFADAFASAQREAQSSFGDPACLIEKFIQNPRHIEMQVMGDAHGNVIHLFERDCSMQRRHQKVIEEAPAPDMPDDVRQAMGAAAVAAAKAVNYQGAGTVEFIVDGSGPLRPDGFWFMEMNTRLQVEHPVTEEITGFDLVAMQIAVAEGETLPVTQDQITATGHAFEVRLYAEDPSNGFLPATGTLDILDFPTADNGVRVDTAVRQGDVISPHYDPMIAKLIVTGPNRNAALLKMSKALEELVVHGCVTNRAFLSALVIDADFAAGRVDTGLIDRKGADLTVRPDPTAHTLALAALAAVFAMPVAVMEPRQLGARIPVTALHRQRRARHQGRPLDFQESPLGIGQGHDRPPRLDDPRLLRGDLLDSGLAGAVLAEFARRFGDVFEEADFVEGEAHGAHVFGEGLEDRLADPPNRVGDEFVALGAIEAVSRCDQTEIAGADQIGERQASILVLLGDRNDKTKI